MKLHSNFDIPQYGRNMQHGKFWWYIDVGVTVYRVNVRGSKNDTMRKLWQAKAGDISSLVLYRRAEGLTSVILRLLLLALSSAISRVHTLSSAISTEVKWPSIVRTTLDKTIGSNQIYRSDKHSDQLWTPLEYMSDWWMVTDGYHSVWCGQAQVIPHWKRPLTH